MRNDTPLKFPTFLVIGAQKCATSWLAKMVEQHPQVSVGVKKELHFFNLARNYQKGAEWYASQFSTTPNTKALGEFTPNYFWTSPYQEKDREGFSVQNEQIPRLVHALIPDVQIIVSIREPVSRAVSSYFHQIRDQNIKPGESILEVAHLHGIESMGYYDVHFENWFKHFQREQFLILFYEEDVLADGSKQQTLKRVFQHIGVDDSFEPTQMGRRFNPKRPFFDLHLNQYPLPPKAKKAIKKLTPTTIQNSERWDIQVTEAEREELKARYKPHNQRLESILGRPLPW